MSEVQPASRRDQVAARANAYHALVAALVPPAEWSPSLAETLRGGLCPLGGELSKRAEALAAAAEAAMLHPESVSVAHARLFFGPFEMKAAPWASLYLDPEQRLMGPVSQYAAKAYAEAGLGPGSGLNDAPDHITHELEFMYYLAFEEATTGDDIWQERQRKFWNEHLGRWLPKLALAMRQADVDPYYGALAEILLAFSEAEAEQLGLLASRRDEAL